MARADDHLWNNLTGGYRTQFDPRPLLARLETESDTTETWQQLWGELHHQGDVGDASYAAVPNLVEIYKRRAVVDWNTYAIVAVIELARTRPQNPGLPEWLTDKYFRAIQDLAHIGAEEIFRADEPETSRAILSVIAIAKGLRTQARFVIEYTEDELLEIDSRM